MADENKTGTEYVVLRDEGISAPPEQRRDSWSVVGTAPAATREGAIKAVAGENEGRYKAVPARSWAGTVAIEVTTVKQVKATSTD